MRILTLTLTPIQCSSRIQIPTQDSNSKRFATELATRFVPAAWKPVSDHAFARPDHNLSRSSTSHVQYTPSARASTWIAEMRDSAFGHHPTPSARASTLIPDDDQAPTNALRRVRTDIGLEWRVRSLRTFAEAHERSEQKNHHRQRHRQRHRQPHRPRCVLPPASPVLQAQAPIPSPSPQATSVFPPPPVLIPCPRSCPCPFPCSHLWLNDACLPKSRGPPSPHASRVSGRPTCRNPSDVRFASFCRRSFLPRLRSSRRSRFPSRMQMPTTGATLWLEIRLRGLRPCEKCRRRSLQAEAFVRESPRCNFVDCNLPLPASSSPGC